MKSLSCCRISKKVFLIAAFTLLAISASKGTAVANMRNYCQVPPYVVQNIPPNILVIFDNSGSMHEFAYSDDLLGIQGANRNCSGTGTACTLYNYPGRSPSHRYYGYFDPNKWYVFASSRFSPYDTRVANSWSGDFLNWLTMRRVDILRKIMTGGKPSGTVITAERPDGTSRGAYKRITAEEAVAYTPYTEALYFVFEAGAGGQPNFSVRRTSFTGTSLGTFTTNVVVPLPAEGVLQSVVGARARIGLMFYNMNDGGRVAQGITNFSLPAVINQINNTYPNTNTPLGETLWSGVGYFAQRASTSSFPGSFGLGSGPGPMYFNGDYTVNTNADPMNFGSGGQPRYPTCQQNFIMLLTDGEPTQDGNLPTNLLRYAEGKSSYACVGATCPGFSGHGYDFPASNPGASGLEDVALFMHTNSMRPDIGGFRNITLYTVFAFGRGSTLLKYASINGGFERYGPGDMPTPLSAGPPFNWDLDGDGVPDTYFEATDGAELEAAVRNAFTGILRRASSGTAASVLASGEGTGANLVQALYYPRRSMGNNVIEWTGMLQTLWYYLDPFFANATILEDTDEDRVLTLDPGKDKIVQFYFDPDLEMTYARRWSSDSYGNPVSPEPSVSFEHVKSLWEAGRKLWSKDPNRRVIFTATGSYDNVAGMTSRNITRLSDVPRATLSSLMLETGEDLETTIRYITGIDNDNLRPRTVSVDGGDPSVWKLGDIINSTPRVVAGVQLNNYDKVYFDTTYRDFISDNTYKDRGMVFVGSNAGMLHAFRLGSLQLHWEGKLPEQKARLFINDTNLLGDEAWSFVPKNALPYLKYLKDPNYCHLYYVDLPPYVFDASIGVGSGDESTRVKSKDSWRTVLIGGMRTGGACSTAANCDQCSTNAFANACNNTVANNCVRTPDGGNVGYSSYFALDITNPESPSLLWEFSHRELGFATTGPAVIRINGTHIGSGQRHHSVNGEWYVVFGSGPTGPIDSISHQFLGRSNQRLKFFVLELKTGRLMQVIDSEIDNAFAGSMVNSVADFELDYQDEAIYVGYITKGTGMHWNNGGVGRIVTKGTTPGGTGNSGRWEFSKIIDNVGPVTSGVTRLQNKNLSVNWLFFGTGRYYYEIPAAGDDTTPIMDDGVSQRKIYGIKEPCFTGNNTINFGCVETITESMLRDVTNLTNVPTEDAANATDNTAAFIRGWYINLDRDGNYTYDNVTRRFNAERVVTDPVPTTAGVVYFTSYKPYGDECALGGRSFLWAVRYNTGGAPVQGLLRGKALMQLSTASIEQIDLSTAFQSGDKGGRRTGAIEGIPPYAQGLSLLAAPPPVRRIMHMTEK